MRKVILFVCLVFAVNNSFAQKMSRYRLPSPESAVYDNNGNDLRGFIKTNKPDLDVKADVVTRASGGSWSYLQVKNVKVPAINKDGALNYTETFDATLALSGTTTPAKATWWAREYNSGKGKLTWFDRGEDKGLGMPLAKYSSFINEINTKKMVLVEYVDTVYNMYDYDDMLNNSIFIKRGAIRDVTEYAELVKFYNGFMEKFSTTNDPVLEGKSFVTFFKGGNNQYVAYFNVVNKKITGTLVPVDAPFENDRIRFINNIFRKLTGSNVYIYGDEYFGMDRIVRNRADANNLKMEFVKTTGKKVFNRDI